MTKRSNGLNAVERAFDVFRQCDEGLNVHEFTALLELPRKHKNPSRWLSQFVKEGLAQKVGDGSRPTVYVPTGRAFTYRIREERSETRKRKRPTDAELIELREFKEQAERELTELRTFKAYAIYHYPDLEVPEPLRIAREKVANKFREDGDEARAGMTERGGFDDRPWMRAFVENLAGGVSAS